MPKEEILFYEVKILKYLSKVHHVDRIRIFIPIRSMY